MCQISASNDHLSLMDWRNQRPRTRVTEIPVVGAKIRFHVSKIETNVKSLRAWVRIVALSRRAVMQPKFRILTKYFQLWDRKTLAIKTYSLIHGKAQKFPVTPRKLSSRQKKTSDFWATKFGEGKSTPAPSQEMDYYERSAKRGAKFFRK